MPTKGAVTLRTELADPGGSPRSSPPGGPAADPGAGDTADAVAISGPSRLTAAPRFSVSLNPSCSRCSSSNCDSSSSRVISATSRAVRAPASSKDGHDVHQRILLGLRDRRGVPGRPDRLRAALQQQDCAAVPVDRDRKSTRLNSSHMSISYAVFCLKKKKKKIITLLFIKKKINKQKKKK